MKWLCSLVVLLLLASTHAVYADTYAHLTLSGDYNDGEPLGGFILLDTTTGTIIDGNFFPEGPPLTEIDCNDRCILTEDNFYGGAFVQFQNTIFPPFGEGETYIDVVLPVSTLIGYSGGPLCSDTYLCPLGMAPGDDAVSTVLFDEHSVDVTDGQFTLNVETVTPEPESLLLVATGAASVLGVGWRKIRSS